MPENVAAWRPDAARARSRLALFATSATNNQNRHDVGDVGRTRRLLYIYARGKKTQGILKSSTTQIELEHLVLVRGYQANEDYMYIDRESSEHRYVPVSRHRGHSRSILYQ